MITSYNNDFIPETIDSGGFSNSPAQNFLEEWCSMNGSVVPVFVSREEYQEKGDNILDKTVNSQTLYLPNDVNLFDMSKIVRILDTDTFQTQPEKANQSRNIIELGKTFEKAGLYLNKYSNFIQATSLPVDYDSDDKDTLIANREKNAAKAKQLAIEMANQFYTYGVALQDKYKGEKIPENQEELSEEDEALIDRWLLGNKAHNKRIKSLESKNIKSDVMTLRQKTISTYFKSLAKEGFLQDGKVSELFMGPVGRLQNKTKDQLSQVIKAPERELMTSIFKKGLKDLITNLNAPIQKGIKKSVNDLLSSLGINFQLPAQKLYEEIKIEQLKQELKEVTLTGDINKISQKELEIVKGIHYIICQYPYELASYMPKRILETESLNCLGSSILGGGILDELGLKYVVVDLPNHSITIMKTSNNKLYWTDFTPPNGYKSFKEIQNSDILDLNDNSKNIQISIVADFIDNSNSNAFSFRLAPSFYSVPRQHSHISLFKPEIGFQVQILGNLAEELRNDLSDLEAKELMESYKPVIQLLNYANSIGSASYSYITLGKIFSKLNKPEQSAIAYKKATELDPNNIYTFITLGEILMSLNKFEDAANAYNRVMQINPDNRVGFVGYADSLKKLGKNHEVVDLYKQDMKRTLDFFGRYSAVAENLKDIGEYEAAIEFFREDINMHNDDSRGYMGIGYAQMELGKGDDAVTAFKEAIMVEEEAAPAKKSYGLMPDYADLYYGLGKSLKFINNIPEAISTFQKVIEFDPDYVDAYYDLATLFQSAADRNSAAQYYKKFIELNSNQLDPRVKSAMEYISQEEAA